MEGQVAVATLRMPMTALKPQPPRQMAVGSFRCNAQNADDGIETRCRCTRRGRHGRCNAQNADDGIETLAWQARWNGRLVATPVMPMTALKQRVKAREEVAVLVATPVMPMTALKLDEAAHIPHPLAVSQRP